MALEIKKITRDGVEFLPNIADTSLWTFYHKWRKTPCFSYGDISHTLIPRKKVGLVLGLYCWRCAIVSHQAVHRKPEECMRFRNGI